MTELLDHPAVQGGVAPLIVALIVATALARTRFAWLAIVAGYAACIALSTGFGFSPLTASRKILLLGLLAPVAGIALDLPGRASARVTAAVAVIAGLLSVWVFWSVLVQREGAALYMGAAGIAAFTAVLTALVLSLRDDGVQAGAAGVGLGLSVGIAAVLSASISFLLSGVAIAASAGALLLAQVVCSRNIAAGFIGTLTIGLLVALFAGATLLLAEMPWYALALLLLVPLAVRIPAGERLPFIGRAALLAFYALVAAALPVAAAWYHARGSFS
ncbi:MAG: hypothetical protein ABI624_11960 [Casimicrobiaceae bacterium]